MTLWQWVFYAGAFLLIGSLMTLLSMIAGFIILGKEGCRQYIGQDGTLDKYYGLARFMRHMAALTFLVLLAVLLAVRVGDPADLFRGALLALWPALSMVAAGLGVLSIALGPNHSHWRTER